MANTSLVTQGFKLAKIQDFIDSFANDIYYAFASNYVPVVGDDTPSNVTLDFESVYNTPWRSMIFGKRLTSSDVKIMVKNYAWEANNVYSAWDHQEDLNSDEYFVIVNNVSEYYAFKCLKSPGTNSTSQPLKADTSADDDFYITNDGYHWKYMFTIDTTNYQKFATSNYVPVVEDASVIGNAIPGTIDSILVSNGGLGYAAHGANTFRSRDIAISGNNLLYGLRNNFSANNDFYNEGCIKITGGTGAGQLRKIVDNFVSGDDINIVLESEFNPTPDVTSTYEISPMVTVLGSGSNCIARALVNSTAGNTIYSVEILNRGSGYTNASAVVTGNTGGANTIATLRVILAPRDGHGSHPAEELGSKTLGISSTFANNEVGTIPTEGEFKQFGIIKNPVFSRVELVYTIVSGQFSYGEEVIQVKPLVLNGTVSVNTSSDEVVGTNTLFLQVFSANDLIQLGTSVRQVVSVTNNTHLFVNTTLDFISAVATHSKFEQVYANGIVSNVTVSNLMIGNSSGMFRVSNTNYLVGKDLGGVAKITDVNLNTLNKGYSTIDQRYRFVTNTGLSVAFSQGAVIHQGNTSVASAVVHHFDSTAGILYVTNVVGNFTLGVNVQSGGNSCILNEIINPDIVPFKGDIIYLENIRPAERSNTTFQLFKQVISF